MPQITTIKEVDCVKNSRNYVPLGGNDLEIVCVISLILEGVNLEVGGFNTEGLVYSLDEGGENNTLIAYNTIQIS